MKYDSISDICRKAEEKNVRISEFVLQDQAALMEKTEEDLKHTMKTMLEVIKKSTNEGINPEKRSNSGLSGGDAYKMEQRVKAGQTISGPIIGKALTKALSTSENNACMGKIVAAPTAGSCGIIPAVLITIAEERKLDDEQLVMALFTASAVGMVIANRASISGAEGGCQAECGSASAMAAAALVELCGGTPAMVEHACAISLKSVLGLVCDPVAGLVEIPCIKRNAMGAANAFVAAELALAGIESKIPVDEVIQAMKSVGDCIVPALKETADGGLAATPTAKKYMKQIFG
ncbi:L-serine ammonia-lyase, iron-sulfur-dependent, subunit alpha [Anaerocolumna sedimenticola]|uniref:L-serine dehydratase n=1 Tax=Anaerocolumna sedimenticola TaxID=2696063 RepID=A0A6P1TGN2_9FIRM|nr:L-serine ammonia-lyase, iron-sulfur-dependent, subunit alpha [Anaerocolumna sedimenticola]QHQ59583.1 L-serine ammonia-lyase, iron-sulfur-dependent, subunit alpha [Anaerocolumna sedimenticola]